MNYFNTLKKNLKFFNIFKIKEYLTMIQVRRYHTVATATRLQLKTIPASHLFKRHIWRETRPNDSHVSDFVFFYYLTHCSIIQLGTSIDISLCRYITIVVGLKYFYLIGIIGYRYSIF